MADTPSDSLKIQAPSSKPSKTTHRFPGRTHKFYSLWARAFTRLEKLLSSRIHLPCERDPTINVDGAVF